MKAVEVDTAKATIRIEMEVRRDRPWACPACHRAMHVQAAKDISAAIPGCILDAIEALMK